MHELRQAQGVSSKMGFEGPHMNFVNVQHRPSHGKKKKHHRLRRPCRDIFSFGLLLALADQILLQHPNGRIVEDLGRSNSLVQVFAGGISGKKLT